MSEKKKVQTKSEASARVSSRAEKVRAGAAAARSATPGKARSSRAGNASAPQHVAPSGTKDAAASQESSKKNGKNQVHTRAAVAAAVQGRMQSPPSEPKRKNPPLRTSGAARAAGTAPTPERMAPRSAAASAASRSRKGAADGHIEAAVKGPDTRQGRPSPGEELEPRAQKSDAPTQKAAAAGRKARPAPDPARQTSSQAGRGVRDANVKLHGAASAPASEKKTISQRHGFKTNEYIVYPAHGVGRIIGIEEQEIAGMALELFVISFDKEKLTLRVPTGKLQSVGMRKLAESGIVKKAMDILKGKARIKRTMWSRRAQEYIAKINSGDLIAVAEVVRDLYRSQTQPEQSYSERQLYEDALDRMAREIAAIEKLDERTAAQRITELLARSARSRREAEEAGIDGTEEGEGAESEKEAGNGGEDSVPPDSEAA